jgi:hypothetical protein
MASDASGPWTDFEQHDPGVTVLELLVYALVDAAEDFGRRIRIERCGPRCTIAVAAGAASAAGAMLLAQRRRSPAMPTPRVHRA